DPLSRKLSDSLVNNANPVNTKRTRKALPSPESVTWLSRTLSRARPLPLPLRFRLSLILLPDCNLSQTRWTRPKRIGPHSRESLMHTDDTVLPPDQRRRELAALLARGLRRLHEIRRRPANSPDSPIAQNPTKIVANCLAIPAET